MHFATILQGVGSVGMFSSRAFLPALVTAVALRYGPEYEILSSTGLFENISDVPTWFTSNTCISILSLLSLLEIAATKSPEARQLLQEVDSYLKSGMAGLTYMGVISATEAQLIESQIQRAGFVDIMPAVAVAFGVWMLGEMRNGVLRIVTDADEDDSAGVQGLISWAEDVWATAGILLLIIYPIVMLVLIGIVVALLAAARKYAQIREEKSKIACSSCSAMIYACAVNCPACNAKNDSPNAVGFLGGTKPYPAIDKQDHPFRLAEKKRCPVCATRFEKRAVDQTCGACGHKFMADPQFANEYFARINRRLPLVLVVSFLFSLIPVVGLIPGVIYYRLALVAPFRRYIPFGRSFLLRWAVRLIFIVLIVMQVVPGLGGFAVPIMAIISYVVYRSTFRAMLPAAV